MAFNFIFNINERQLTHARYMYGYQVQMCDLRKNNVKRKIEKIERKKEK